MGTGRHGQGELVEHRLHGGCAHLGENQGDAVVALGADGAEQIDRLMPEIAAAARADAFLEPAAAGAAGLANSGLVEEPELELLSLGMDGGDFSHQPGEVYSNVRCALNPHSPDGGAV